MKVKLLKDCAPFGRTGETVEVSPVHFEWVTSIGCAVPVTEAREQAEEPAEAAKKQPARKATAKKK